MNVKMLMMNLQFHLSVPVFHPVTTTTTTTHRAPVTLVNNHYLSQTTRSRPARSRRRTRCTPRRCGGTGWWPRRCPRAPSWPPAPSAPEPSSAGCLERRKGGGGGSRRVSRSSGFLETPRQRRSGVACGVENIGIF